MKQILLADSGSTKTTWRLGALELRTKGINPYFTTTTEIVELLEKELCPLLPSNTFDEIHFYGAGCTPEKSPIVSSALHQVFIAPVISVQSDMLGAARALCQHQPGVACILGTGSNSCSYDGENMVQNVSPLGYILGDEGSGAVLGKLFVGAVLKNQMPLGLKEHFLEHHNTNPAEIIDRVYRQPHPNTYLASFAPYIAQHLNLPEVYHLVEDAFRCFIIRNVRQYPIASSTSVHFVGSVAYHFQAPLRSACAKEHITIGTTAKEPIDGLYQYHYPMNDFIKITESSSLYNNLEHKKVGEILREINQEDHKIADAVAQMIPVLQRFVEQALPRIERGGRIFYIGAGTSGRLGVLDASEIPPTFGMPPTLFVGLIAGGDHALRHPVENAEDSKNQAWEDLQQHNIASNDTLIGIAASGTTPYVIAGLQEARKRGILTACITSNPGSPITEAAEYAIVTIVGPEYVTGSSRMKSGTAQKMVLNMISTSLMIKMGRVEGNRMVNMQLSNQKLIDRGTRMLVEALGLTYTEAREQLIQAGSVRAVLDKYQI